MESNSFLKDSSIDGNNEKSEKNNKGFSSSFIDEKLFKSRSITIFGEINDKLARNVTEHLLALAAESDECRELTKPGGIGVDPALALNWPGEVHQKTVSLVQERFHPRAAPVHLAAQAIKHRRGLQEDRHQLPGARFPLEHAVRHHVARVVGEVGPLPQTVIAYHRAARPRAGPREREQVARMQKASHDPQHRFWQTKQWQW